MKIIKLASLCLILITCNIFTQNEEPPPYTGEIKIGNSSSTRTIYIKVYPVSMVFNGRYLYDLHTLYPDNRGEEQYRYMTGVSLINDIPLTIREIPPNTYKSFDFEFVSGPQT